MNVMERIPHVMPGYVGELNRRMSDVKGLSGQVWTRRNGSQFIIERSDERFAYYWLEAGSRPQFRSIALDRLKPPVYRRLPHLGK